MTVLSPSYIQSQAKLLGDYTVKALEKIDDPALVERTLIYRNLRLVAREKNGSSLSKTDVIAKTVADILDSQAWLDYVEVDGSRRSCESLAKFLEQSGLDPELAEYALGKQKRDYLAKFYEARDGKLLTHEQTLRNLIPGVNTSGPRDSLGRLLPTGVGTLKPKAKATGGSRSYLERRLARDFPDLYQRLNSQEITFTQACVEAKLVKSEIEKKAIYLLGKLDASVKQYYASSDRDALELLRDMALAYIKQNPLT